MSTIERLTGLSRKDQTPVFLVGLGHGGIHWVVAVFYVLLPYMAHDLNLSYTQAGLLVTLLHAVSLGTNLFSGLLVDLTGHRVMHQVGSLLACAAALAGFALYGNLVWVGLMIVIMGATQTHWHPAAISYVSARFPTHKGYALSIHAMGASAGDTVAPLAAGAVLVYLGWGATAGVVAIPVALTAIVLAIGLRSTGKGAVEHKTSVKNYLSGMGQLLTDKAVLGLVLMSGLRTMTQGGLLVFLPLYLTDVMLLGPFLMGMTLALMQVGGVIATPFVGVWSDRIGRRSIVLGGLTMSTVLIAGLSIVGNDVAFIVGTAALGFALFAVRPVVHGWMMDLTPPELGGSATSLMFGVQAGLTALTPFIGGMIADAWGLGAVFYGLAGTMLVANLAAVTLTREASKATE